MSIPTPPAGATVYRHPQGKVIHVMPDGTMATYKANGTRATSSATPAKLAAGYGGWARVSGDDAPGPIPELAEAAIGGMAGMVYSEVRIEDIMSWLENDKIVVEQKLDGTRCIITIDKNGVRFSGRNGQPLKHAAAAQHFAKLREEIASIVGEMKGDDVIVLDGELISETGELWLFDCPKVDMDYMSVKANDTFDSRRGALIEIMGSYDGPIKLTPQARTTEDKKKLLKDIEDVGGEGIMLKRIDTPYDGGTRVKHSVKVKFVKTADVVVLERDVKGKKNALLGVYDPSGFGSFIEVGACSMIGKADAEVGAVIEVAYLNWTGTKLYQPRFMRLRNDKTPAETSMDQFPLYSRKVIEL